MDQGFFHPQRGYWQAVGGASREVRAAYPEGTIEVPLKPGADFDWIDGEWRALTPMPPAPPPVPQELSFAQLLIGLVAEGWITEAEGDAWMNRQLPAAVNALIAGLPQAERFAARARAKLPSVVLRNDALVVALATQQGKTAEQLDDFFRTYANV